MTQLLGNAAFLSLLDVKDQAEKPSRPMVAVRDMVGLFGGDLTQNAFCAMAMPYNLYSAQHERYLQVDCRLMTRLETLFLFSFVNHRGAENTEFFLPRKPSSVSL